MLAVRAMLMRHREATCRHPQDLLDLARTYYESLTYLCSLHSDHSGGEPRLDRRCTYSAFALSTLSQLCRRGLDV